MTEFLGEISKNPDLLEDFYQKTFVGLDSQGGLPGMRRIKANGFFIISGTKLEEAGRVEKYDTRAVGTFFSSLEKHQYQQGPYGTGDAFQPKYYLISLEKYLLPLLPLRSIYNLFIMKIE